MTDPRLPRTVTRMKSTCVLLTVLGALLLGGCGSSAPESAAKPTPTPSSATPTPTPTPTIAVVSEGTICEQIFPTGKGQTSPLEAPITLVNTQGDATPDQLSDAADALDTLRTLSKQSPPSLRGQIETYLGQMQPYVDDLESQGTGTIDDTTTMKTAATEIINVCTSLQ